MIIVFISKSNKKIQNKNENKRQNKNKSQNKNKNQKKKENNNNNNKNKKYNIVYTYIVFPRAFGRISYFILKLTLGSLL